MSLHLKCSSLYQVYLLRVIYGLELHFVSVRRLKNYSNKLILQKTVFFVAKKIPQRTVAKVFGMLDFID